MKFIHVSDLHLGKRLNEYSLIEDQKYILKAVLNIIDDEKPDGILIAGDVYDKSVPSAEAVVLLDDFLTKLAEKQIGVYLISGNHDSPERMQFGYRLMEQSGIHIAGCYDGNVAPVTVTDEFGELNIYLLPFLKPSQVRARFPEAKIECCTDAMRAVLDRMEIDTDKRNILVTHQFVTGAVRCESEDMLGGLDGVDVSVLEDFDYVALGHIHRPQSFLDGKVRYCGTPLKYSFSEVDDRKSVTVVEIREKGDLKLKTVPLTPMRELRSIRGSYAELTAKDFYDGTDYQNAYLRIILTDEEDVYDAIGKLRSIYHNIMSLSYDNRRTRSNSTVVDAAEVENKSPMELFSELFEIQHNHGMSDEQKAFIDELIKDIWGIGE